jgi:hypothetical protein
VERAWPTASSVAPESPQLLLTLRLSRLDQISYNRYMVIVDGDLVSNIVGSYLTWVAYMLRIIELIMMLVGCILYKLYE